MWQFAVSHLGRCNVCRLRQLIGQVAVACWGRRLLWPSINILHYILSYLTSTETNPLRIFRLVSIKYQRVWGFHKIILIMIIHSFMTLSYVARYKELTHTEEPRLNAMFILECVSSELILYNICVTINH